MANEITVTGSIAVNKSGTTSQELGRSFTALQFTMSGTVLAQGTISVGTSAEAIPVGEVTTPHWAFFKNLDSTNYIKIRNGSTGADVIRLKAGEVALVPLEPTATFYAIADTAACRLDYMILDT